MTKKIEGKKLRKQSKASLPKLKRKAWKVFSTFIKGRDGNVCISCGKRGLVKSGWHAGHYQKAELCNIVYRYDERMVASQCAVCNLWRRGNTIEYRKALIKKYGEKVVKELEEHYKDPLPMDFSVREFYEEIIKKYDKKRD